MENDVIITSYRTSLSLSICYKNKNIRYNVYEQEILINIPT